MKKIIFLPNFLGGLQIPPKTIEEIFGQDTRTFLFIFFESFFIIAKFDETKALADQTRAFEECFAGEKSKNFQINTLHGSLFKMSRAQLEKNTLSHDFDVLIGLFGVLEAKKAIPYIAIQPASVDSIICEPLKRFAGDSLSDRAP